MWPYCHKPSPAEPCAGYCGLACLSPHVIVFLSSGGEFYRSQVRFLRIRGVCVCLSWGFYWLMDFRAVYSQIESFCRRKFWTRSRDSARPMPFHRTTPKPDGFIQNSPGPSGFRLADTRFVRQRRPMETHRTCHLPRGLSRHPRNRTDPIWL